MLNNDNKNIPTFTKYQNNEKEFYDHVKSKDKSFSMILLLVVVDYKKVYHDG